MNGTFSFQQKPGCQSCLLLVTHHLHLIKRCQLCLVESFPTPLVPATSSLVWATLFFFFFLNCCGTIFQIGTPSPTLSSLQTFLYAEPGARSQNPALHLLFPSFQAFTGPLLLLRQWPVPKNDLQGSCLLVSLIPHHAPPSTPHSYQTEPRSVLCMDSLHLHMLVWSPDSSSSRTFSWLIPPILRVSDETWRASLTPDHVVPLLYFPDRNTHGTPLVLLALCLPLSP